MPSITAATLLNLVLTAPFQLLLIAAFALLNTTNQIAPLAPTVTAALQHAIAVLQTTPNPAAFAKKIAKLPASPEFPTILQQLRQAAL